ncbi:MAG: HisA/HisF-related TIM barrel protein [Methylomicrobium sp.]
MLCNTAEIRHVIDGFLTLHDFRTIYLADLNAIVDNETLHENLIDTLLSEYPHVTFWIDAGFDITSKKYYDAPNFIPVLGSESINDESNLLPAKRVKDFVLSLDFSTQGELGPKRLFERSDYWPQRVAIMTLAHVGSDLGPDFEKLKHYRTAFPDRDIIAAGGVRNKQDLLELKNIGIGYTLIASALHAGQLTAQDIDELESD